MPDNCEHWHRVIAERALRGLDSETEREVSTHLAACEESRALAAEFGTIAAALAHARPERRVVTPVASAERSYVPSPEHLYSQIAARLDVGRTRRRRRTLAIGLAAAAALIGIVAVSITMSRSAKVAAPQVLFSNDVVDGAVSFESRSWGTEIHLRAEGFTPGQQYNVWLERADGSRVGAGTFTGVTHPPVIVTLSSALNEAHAVAIGISKPDGTLVMRRSLT
jgi:hypothetical protein